MRSYLFTISLSCILTFTFSNFHAQTDSLNTTKRVNILMKNGQEFTGVILKQDAKTLVLKTKNGELNLIATNVKRIETDIYKGAYRFENPHDTRYFFGPTGIPIKKGKGYYQNVLLTTNFVNYGVTKNISIGGGFEFISTLLGSPIWFLTPKVGFQLSKNAHIGGGFIMAGLAADGAATLAYGSFTAGNSDANVSVGIGYGLVNGNFSNYPAIMIAGTSRLTNGLALLTENYVFPDGTNTPTYFGIHGFRILSKKNSFDIGGIFIPSIFEYIPALPYVGYVRVF